MNLTWTWETPEPISAVNPATGAAGISLVMYPVLVSMSVPSAFVAVRLTVQVPRPVYMWTGCCSAEVPPSPKSQDQEVGKLAEVSVNRTGDKRSDVSVLDVKSATGATCPV